jgi:hypothetical protein
MNEWYEIKWKIRKFIKKNRPNEIKGQKYSLIKKNINFVIVMIQKMKCAQLSVSIQVKLFNKRTFSLKLFWLKYNLITTRIQWKAIMIFLHPVLMIILLLSLRIICIYYIIYIRAL